VAGDDIETRKIGRDRITKAALVKNFRSQAFFFAQDSRQYVFGESDWSGVSLALKEAQNSQGTECVPAARSSLPTFHVEVDLALMGLIERPSPVLVSTPCHQVDGFVGPFIGPDASLSQVVQAPQDVVMPTSGKRESCPARSMIFTVAMDDLSG